MPVNTLFAYKINTKNTKGSGFLGDKRSITNKLNKF